MAPITMPILFTGLLTCIIVEKFSIAGFGNQLPLNVREVFNDYSKYRKENITLKDKTELLIESVVLIFLVLALAFSIAAVGLIGLSVMVLLTAFKGITHEHKLGDAFHEALPFTALLAVFFAIVSVLAQPEAVQPSLFYVANGFLSAVSDNVFVATIYIGQVAEKIPVGTEQFNNLAIAINVGTNIPSIATPNGQAAFLFLLTSALAPLINLSYLRMVYMALPYTIILSIVGYISIANIL